MYMYIFIIPPLPEGGGGYTVLPLSVCPSFRPSKIFFVAFFSVTVDGRNLIFGHKLHIGTPYRGKRFWTKFTTVTVNNETISTKKNNILYDIGKMQVLAWDRHKNVTGLNWLISTLYCFTYMVMTFV
jgi:hypothetical protein